MRSSARRRLRRPGVGRPSLELTSLSRICYSYRETSAADCSSVKALYGSVPGYTVNGVKQATYKEGLVSFPDPGAKMADGSALLAGSDL